MKLGYMIASNHVAKEGRPVGYLYREEPDDALDSGWRVFSGDETQEYVDDPANFALYNASTIVELDPSIIPLPATPAPAAYERNSAGDFVAIDET